MRSSVVKTAAYERKHDAHIISHSFIATNCPDIIFATSLAVTGGRADESTIGVPGCTMPTDGLVLVTSAGRVVNDCTMLTARLALTLPWLKVAMPAIANAGGNVPKETLCCVVDGPVGCVPKVVVAANPCAVPG